MDGNNRSDLIEWLLNGSNPSSLMLGDLDSDNKITAFDAYKALLISVEYMIDEKINSNILQIVDVNKNNLPEAGDAYKILKYSVGLIDKF